MHPGFHPDESDLLGQWLDIGSRIEGDAVTARIGWLTITVSPELGREGTAERLERLGAAGGWELLYRDPRDGRLWELIYPHSELHGGGPPRLYLLSPAEAQAKYRLGAA